MSQRALLKAVENQQPGMLLNFQVVITTEIDAAVTAVARAFDRDKRDVVREVLGQWAARKLVEAKVLTEISAGGCGLPLLRNREAEV